jgi:uncharacterized protein YgbK (DUF1537 family)
MISFLIADDLTGAADASVHFAGSRSVEILLPASPPAFGWGSSEADVVVFDTESRGLEPSRAAHLVASACEGLNGAVFKKVDSTLRGSVAAELEAARVALGRGTAVLVPSLPVQGRTVEAGRLLLEGSDAGAIAELLGVAAVSLPIEALGEDRLPELVVIDASTDGDLDRIAAACERRPDLLPAGSAGLAAAFARREGSSTPGAVHPSRRLLIAVASRHPASRAQLAALAAEPRPEIEILAVPADAKGRPWQLAAGLGSQVRDRIAGPLPLTVLATGGDAALAVCRQLGIQSIRPRAEVLPGLVWSETDRAGVALATKAGSFGGPRLLLDAAFKLLGMESGG